MRTTSGVLLFGIVTMTAGAGCAHREADRREGLREARQERREEHREPVRDARGDWVKLGSRTVDGTHDRDVISVGAREGRYRSIMIVCERSALEMHDLIVTFGDGTSFEPRTRHIFSADTRSHVIDLPGADRVIRTVEFHYGNLPGGGRAEADLWAR